MTWLNAVAALLITVASGYADSRGFIHASEMWRGDGLNTGELLRSAIGFATGIALFWVALRFATRAGVVTPEIQTFGWFLVTIVGVAIATGSVAEWPAVDRLLAVGVAAGFGVLLLRVG